ncbi:MAG: T9SS type B sorting domain-containing protein [Flaviramulus sp.]|nr:T9SS type B sorting domain-containing protein [Flaviramulus sp.]
MNLSRLFKGLFFLFTLFSSLQGFSQLSRTHYIPPLTESGSGSSNPQDHYIYISTPKAASFSFTIKPVGQGVAAEITGTVSNATPFIYNIGNGRDTQLFVNANETSTVKNNKGFIIESQDVIYVSVRANAGAQAGALVSKGLAALGTTFRVGSFTNENPQDNYLNFVSVMATEDNTQVSFNDLPAGLVIENYTGITPVTTTLNKGESYTLATNSNNAIINRDGLIGCLVSSDKPIVVNCGSANGSFHNGGARDYGIDQIVDLSKVGTEYIFVKGDGENGWENVLIVAHTNNTTISINGNTPVATINAGDYYLIEGNEYTASGNMYVQTSQPVFAYQGVGATTSEANQGMFFVPPLSCETRGNLDNIANIESIGGTTYTGGISIVTKVGATVTINNTPISNFSSIGPNNVTGKPDYVTYKVTGLTGNISVQSSDELYCAYFNFNGAATSGSFYSGFPSPPEINFDAIFTTLGVCIPNVTLEVANAGSFDSFEWFFDDGNGAGFITTGNTSLQFTPALSGTYKLIGTLNCTNTTLESLEVPVSICPDDTDNDGIPDNTDIDNDNDGILNCTESNGNQDINLSNPTSGSILVGGYTYTGTINTFGTAATTPFVGLADGTFMSETPSRNNAAEESVTYDLVFNNNLNLLFEYATSTGLGNGLLTNDEEFIIRVPNTRTITLLNPDNQLLVDTNFDGIYETGVTQISAFEIRFKLNGTSLALGAGTFSFSANSVNAITYIHKNTSDTSSNQATFKLTTTCVANDNDFDGIEDALDLDSDNDGIPDFVENIGILQPLSGIDADLNGLDDVYDINTLPIDTDGDTVSDFYDLDSDNDGITDLIESGLLGILSDTDLNGIEDGGSFGTNGWADAAETTPDSNLIGYTINDLDNDTIFSYIDADSDGDGCSDVIEAGFSDSNNDDYLGDGAVVVDLMPDSTTGQGLVTNASDGYTLPNSDYLDSAPIIITTQPIDIEVCHLSNTTLSVTLSTPFDSIQWELSTDGITWNPLTDDATYSGSQTTDLTIISTPLSLNNYQYRVRLERNGNSCGLYSDEVNLIVNPLPVANPVLDLELCDNLDDGDDFNGIVQTFDLESQTATILGTQPNTDFTVTYHLSLADATSGNQALTSPHENNASPNSETIYVRVENNSTGCINTNLSFNVIVNPLPVANPVANLELCDDDSDGDNRNGIVQTFNLESQTATILGSLPATNLTVTYHLSVTDAITGSGSLTSPYSNTLSPNLQTIYVRITNIITGCVNPYLTFDLIVNTLPFANTVPDLEACDNTDDGNDTNGIIQTWDLESQTTTILGTQAATDYSVTYHLSLNDAELRNNPLASPHTNTANPNNQTIYVRVENNVTNCVNTFNTFDLIVHPLPIINSPVVLVQCDDDDPSTLGFSPFNLTEANSEISANAINETFTFFLTQAAAISGDITSPNFINNPTTFENRTISSDIIWARIENSFGCIRVSEIQLNVSTTVIPSNFLVTFNQCDDFLDINGVDNTNNDDRDGVATFDFSSVDATILSFIPVGQNPLPPRYFRNEADALAEINEITEISNYRNIGYPGSQLIYVRVDSNIANDCLGLGAHILLNVEPLPLANPVTIIRQCDDDNDGEFPFNTSQVENDLLGAQNPADVIVEYFDELGNPLPSPLPNPFITASQTITIRVTNNTTSAPDGPCFDETSLEFIVDVSPVANSVSPFVVCDGDSGDIDDDDGLYPFNTTNIESTVLGTQTDMDIFYTYFDENGNLISNATSLPNTLISDTQTITVDVVNPSNLVCTASTTIDFIVNTLPEFSIETPQIVCSSDPNFTVVLDPLEDNPSEIYTYDWTNETGTSLSNNSTLTVSTPGTYFITLTKTDGTGCSRTRDVFVNASELATITQDDITIVDISDNNTITINEANLGLGDYEFALDDEFASYKDEPFFDRVKGGVHTLFVRDKNGCGTTSIDISVIDFPNFFTPNGDGFNDSWQILGINAQFQPQSDIYIFDRYGKLLKQINPLSSGWDGTFKGNLMQSDDYWFKVLLQDGREFKGHFTLKR